MRLIFIQPATVVGLVSTVRKSVIARTRTRTVRRIHQKVDVIPAVLHTSREPLVKVTYFVSSKNSCIVNKLQLFMIAIPQEVPLEMV